METCSWFPKVPEAVACTTQPNPSHYMFPTVLQHKEENDVADTVVIYLTGLIHTHLVALIDIGVNSAGDAGDEYRPVLVKIHFLPTTCKKKT